MFSDFSASHEKELKYKIVQCPRSDPSHIQLQYVVARDHLAMFFSPVNRARRNRVWGTRLCPKRKDNSLLSCVPQRDCWLHGGSARLSLTTVTGVQFQLHAIV